MFFKRTGSASAYSTVSSFGSIVDLGQYDPHGSDDLGNISVVVR